MQPRCAIVVGPSLWPLLTDARHERGGSQDDVHTGTSTWHILRSRQPVGRQHSASRGSSWFPTRRTTLEMYQTCCRASAAGWANQQRGHCIHDGCGDGGCRPCRPRPAAATGWPQLEAARRLQLLCVLVPRTCERLAKPEQFHEFVSGEHRCRAWLCARLRHVHPELPSSAASVPQDLPALAAC